MSDSLRWLSALLISGPPGVTGVAKLLSCVTSMLLVVAAITRFWPRTSAAQRHLLWSAACGGILLAPVIQWLVPRYEVRVLPAVEQAPVLPSAPPAPVAAPRPSRTTVVNSTARDISPTTVPQPEPPILSPTAPARTVPWVRVMAMLWGAGTLLMLLALLRSRCQVNVLAATATPLGDPHVRALATELATAAGWRGRIEIRIHPSVVPMVCGIFRPVIVLPEQALTWTDVRLRHVLLHEIAHVARRDMLTQAIASIAVAAYWFHPLVWYGARTLRREREHACDDVVLVTEGRPAVYATDLLDLTGTFVQSRAVSLAALPFARSSHMRDRLHAVLDVTRRRRGVSRRVTMSAWGTVLGLIAITIGITLQPVSTAEAQIFGPRPWYESPVSVGPTILTASGDRPTLLALVFENHTDSVTVSTPTVGFMRTDTNLVMDTSSRVPRSDAPTAMAWIRGLPDTVILQPHQRRLVAFTVTPPPSLAAGVYYATINIPQANQKKIEWKEEDVTDHVQPVPTTVLLVVRHRVPDVPTTHVHLDSIVLIGSRACFRMWTKDGIPYFGTILVRLFAPWEGFGNRDTSVMALEERPVAIYGISAPKRFCTQLTALSDSINSILPADSVHAPGSRHRMRPSEYSGKALVKIVIDHDWNPGERGNGRRAVPHEPQPGGDIYGEASVNVRTRQSKP